MKRISTSTDRSSMSKEHIPRPAQLIVITIERIVQVAEKKGVSPSQLCNMIVGDHDFWRQFSTNKRNITLGTYGRIHQALDEIEVQLSAVDTRRSKTKLLKRS